MKNKKLQYWGIGLTIFSILVAVLLWLIPGSQIKELIKIGKSSLAAIRGIDKKIDDLSKDINKITGGTDCHEITENSWDIQNFIIIDKDSISLKTKKGLIRFKKPIEDLLILDFIFKPTDPESINTTIALKDEKNNEISLTIGAASRQTDAGIQYYQTLYWLYKKADEVIDKDNETFPIFQRNGEIKLRIETIQKPDHLLVSGFILYTPTGKKTSIPFYLKEFSSERFYNKEVFLHLGIENGSQKSVNDVLLKIIQCRINQKPELP
jgi:hypothetical protein